MDMLKSIELSGFKSFAKKSTLSFSSPISGIVGPNGSGKSNTAEAFRFVLGEQSMKALRGKRGPDLIWSGNDRQPKAHRARVALVFDNRRKLLDIDFDEVVVERMVHRDGAHDYTINGSKVRLKDVIELLSSANIGSTGHHIISQGEADRILGASTKERKAMIEEALGLKTFHYKKVESEKKLEKTNENMREAQLQQQELALQRTHLERQVKKVERARALKRQLVEHYTRYITLERLRINSEKRRVTELLNGAEHNVTLARERVTKADAKIETEKDTSALGALDVQTQRLAQEKGVLERRRGKLEGTLSVVTNSTEAQHTNQHIPFVKVEALLVDIEKRIQKAHKDNDTSFLHEVVTSVREFLNQCIPNTKTSKHTDSKEALQKELAEVEESLAALCSEEEALAVARTKTLAALREQKAQQNAYFELKEQLREREREYDVAHHEAQALERAQKLLVDIEHRAQDRGIVYTGQAETISLSKEELQELLSEIDRVEARLDEAGGVDESIIQKYEAVCTQGEFIEKEVRDLEHSQQTLLEILSRLDTEIATRFTEGLTKINIEFEKFFSMLFDGGAAQLDVIKESQSGEDEGIEVRVQLPRKKVTTLEVLSGGERALTSIALIFAMSQVNPPPFIILDETDAALDEANSRRYADMIRALSEKSQLILITHNRQTMEAAGELYGVTMGSDGISKLLSVKFDEAVRVTV
tara:strand:- start:44422 stop:46533 length:2112 start_codon:yes stop_codon:yes gene_type:complete